MIKTWVKVCKSISPWHSCISSEAKGGVETLQRKIEASFGQNGNQERSLRGHWEDHTMQQTTGTRA